MERKGESSHRTGTQSDWDGMAYEMKCLYMPPKYGDGNARMHNKDFEPMPRQQLECD